MKKLNHVKLFEAFSNTENFSESDDYSVVGVFMETQYGIAVLPTSEANQVYEALLNKNKSSETTDIEIVALPPNHDLVIVPLGGKGISTTTEEKLAVESRLKHLSLTGRFKKEIPGSPAHDVHDIVELGKHYDYGDNNDPMVFRANRDLHGFVLLDSAGGTSLLSPEEMIDHIY